MFFIFNSFNFSLVDISIWLTTNVHCGYFSDKYSCAFVGKSVSLWYGGDLKEVVDYAHKFWAKVFVTMNTILTDSELEEAADLAKKLSSTGGLTSAGSKTLTPITDKAMKGGMRLAKDAGKNVGHVAARITHLDELGKYGKDKIHQAQGFLFGAGPQGYRAWWRNRP